jgi:hypothetical protein
MLKVSMVEARFQVVCGVEKENYPFVANSFDKID